jgi:hypothetical protein
VFQEGKATTHGRLLSGLWLFLHMQHERWLWQMLLLLLLLLLLRLLLLLLLPGGLELLLLVGGSSAEQASAQSSSSLSVGRPCLRLHRT